MDGQKTAKTGTARHWIGAVLFALLISAAAQTDLFYRVDNAMCDQMYQHVQVLDGRIFVLAIDEKALTQYGPIQTWDREIMADVVDALNANPDALPAVIGIDMMYYGNTDPQSDQRLAEASDRYGNVVTGSSVNFKNEIIQDQSGGYVTNSFAVESTGQPYPALLAATRQGHLNTMPDEDGFIRAILHNILLPNGEQLPSFAYQIYQTYCERLGLPADAAPPTDSRGFWYIPYAAKPGGYNDSFSVADLLSGDLPGELFADAAVLIGPYATGMRDSYLTPIDRSTPMNGVEIHANILQALMDGNRFMQHVPAGWQSAFLFILMLALYFPFRRLAPKFSTPLLLTLLLGYLWLAYECGQAGWMLKIFYLPTGLVLLYLFWLAAGYLREQMSRKQMTDTFKRYVAPQVVDEIIKSGSESLRLGGQKREIACLFVDIRGFTPLAESLDPEQVVEMLNEALSLTSGAVFAHGGTLDKYIGDATMAIYNAPLPMEDYIYNAIQTAWDILCGSEQLSKKLEEKFGCTMHFGVGVSAGPAVVGNIGTSIRMDYTAIGDTVNTAARLESRAKAGQVLMSEQVYLAVKDRIAAEFMGEMTLDGKSKAVRVYAMTMPGEE